MQTKQFIEIKENMAYADLMAHRQYTAVFKKQKNWILAWIEEIPGVNTQGKTMKEARENLHEALELILEENRIISSRRHANTRREKFVIITK